MSSSISLLLCSNKRCFPGFKNVTRLNTDTFYLLVSVLTGFDCMSVSTFKVARHSIFEGIPSIFGPLILNYNPL